MGRTPLGGCIDRYEASAGEGSLGSPQGAGTTLVPLSVAGKLPLHDVTHAQAAKACRNARKHLCSEAEWMSTCRNRADWEAPGNPPDSYPYGKVFVPKRCNDWDASDRGRKGVAPTGSFPGCVTPTGIFDMANNVGEWTSTPEKAGDYATRGGSYLLTIRDSSCEEDDNTLPATAHHPTIGFRCCRTAEDLRPWYYLW